MASEYHHYSELSTMLTCEWKHRLSYQENLEPVSRNARMDLGTYGHAVLMDRWLGRDGLPSLRTAVDESLSRLIDPSEAPAVHETAKLATAVADRAFKALSARYEVLSDHVEKTLTVRFPWLAKPFGGTPDAIVRDKQSGSAWILDYKFRATFLEQDSEWLNLQMIVYQWLARKNGIHVVGSRQIQIYPNLPKVPELTQKGTMSVADLRTDWETYAKACVDAGLDPEDYRERMTPKLATKRFVDIDGCVGIRRDEELDIHERTTILPGLRRLGSPPEHPIRLCNNMVCGTCSYRELCVSEAKGEDSEFIRGSLYQIKGTRLAIPVLEEDVE